MRFVNFRIIEISLALAVGILTSQWLSLPSLFLWALLPTWLSLLYVYLKDRNRFHPSPIYPILVYFAFFQMGYWLPQFHQIIYKSEAILWQTDSETPSLWTLQIENAGKPNAKFLKYEARVLSKADQSAYGKVQLLLKRDSCSTAPLQNDYLLAYGQLKKIDSSPNPYQFNFKKYMARKGIYHTLYLEQNDVMQIHSGASTIKSMAEKLRNHLIRRLAKSPLRQEARAITQALTLGDRNDINDELYDAYAKAGAVHILAVSGLHVGILMLLLNRILSFLNRFRRGQIIRILLVIGLLWAFALLTGFSPSVVRSVAMFSFLSLGTLTDRPTNGLNTLFLSFFVSLVLAPNWLFHPGFQMSYLAVGSILVLQPQFQKFWRPRFWFVRKGWEIFTVSLAAQLGVAPISIYYFHQFPGLFWLTNWVLLPFMGLLLVAGFLMVLLSLFESMPVMIYKAYDYAVHLINSFIRWTAQNEQFVWNSGQLSLLMVVLAYVLIMHFAFSKKKLLARGVWLVLGMTLLISLHKEFYAGKRQQQLIWFHRYKESLLTIETPNDIKVFSKNTTVLENPTLHSYRQRINKPMIYEGPPPRVFYYGESYYLVIDSLGCYPKYENAIVILTHNPKLHLDRLLNDCKPQMIVADGSNYPWEKQRWQRSCVKYSVPFLDTGEGALIRQPY